MSKIKEEWEEIHKPLLTKLISLLQRVQSNIDNTFKNDRLSDDAQADMVDELLIKSIKDIDKLIDTLNE